MIFSKIIKFHDISMTLKYRVISQGFPGTVGTLYVAPHELWHPLSFLFFFRYLKNYFRLNFHIPRSFLFRVNPLSTLLSWHFEFFYCRPLPKIVLLPDATLMEYDTIREF